MTQRRFDIDNLRNLAVLALLLFHSARLWDQQSWHIKEAQAFLWADAILRLMNPWHMPLLKYAVIVLASGAVSYALCRLIDTNPLTRTAFGLTPR